ncbi:hypothetical protein PGTUg99_019745 [Puccinia graminis f. sp. tritici]|uniref:Uncharacterized protein n=1 Tax=Puccinia graminis f. sp. tritici TaxID=56615 RepID=A0A5B0LJX1_PUCGR|nr:hypothetical protein PGTUg99_019745 [Puccinia graminis f. sp. tritici]
MAPALPPNVPLDPLPALPPNVPLDPLLQDLGTQQTKSQPSQTTEIRATQTKADKDEEDKCDFDKDYDETLKAEILVLHGPVTLPGLMKKFQQVLYNTHVVPIAPVIEPIHKSSRKGSKKRKKLGQGQVAKHDPIYAKVVDKEIDKAQKTKKQVTRKIAHTKLKRARAIQKGLESITKGKDGTDARPPANVLGKRKQPVRSSRLGNLGGKRPRDAADSSDGDNTSLESSGVPDEESDQEGVASEAYEESTNVEGQGNVNMIPSESGVLDYPLVPKTSDPQGNIGPIPTVPGVLDNPHGPTTSFSTPPRAELPQGHVGMTPMVLAGPQGDTTGDPPMNNAQNADTFPATHLSEGILLVGGTTSPAQEGILLVDGEDSLLVDEAVQPRRPGGFPPGRRYNLADPGGNPPGRQGCRRPGGTALSTRRESSWSTRLYKVVQPRRPGGNPPGQRYNLAGPGGNPPGRQGCRRPGGFPPGRRGCTTSPTRRIPS